MKKRIHAVLRHPRVQYYRGSPRFWVFLAISLSALVIFAQTADEVLELRQGEIDESHLLDFRVMRLVASFRTPALTQVMTDLTALGSFSVVTLFTLVALLILAFLGDRLGLLYLLVTLTGAAAWPNLLKPVFGRSRPPADGRLVDVFDFSFPSGHTFAAATAYTALAFLTSRHLPKLWQDASVFVLAFLVVSLVALSRVYLGVHFPSDVLGGASAGAAWAFLVSAFFVRARTR